MRPIEKVLCVLAFCALVPAYWVNFRAPAIGLYHDDGIYVVTAKALAEGKGYRIISLPDAIPQLKYPPVFPLVLAVVWKIYPHFPQNVPPLKLVPLVSEVVWLYLAFLYIREKTGSARIACWIAFLTAASPWVLFMGVVPLSETTFACFVTATLLIMLFAERDNARGWGLICLAAILTALAVLTRTAGLPLVLAGFGSLLFRKRFVHAFMFLLVVALLVSPWILWTRANQVPFGSLWDYYTNANYGAWNVLHNFSWSEKLTIIANNIFSSWISPGVLLGMAAPFPVLITIVPFFGALVVAGWVLDAKRGFSTCNLFVVIYSTTVVLWAWPPARFYVPVLPLLLLYGYDAFGRFLTGLFLLRQPLRISGWIGALALVPFIFHGLYSQVYGTLKTHSAGLPYSEFDDWDSLQSTYGWINKNTAPNVIVMSNLDPLTFLFTERRGVRGFTAKPFELLYAKSARNPLGSPSEMVDKILDENVDYIVRTASLNFRESEFLNFFIDRTAAEHPEALQLVEGGADPGYRIYLVDRAKLAVAFGKALPASDH